MSKIGDWYWHVHHEVLCEPLTEPLANRRKYVRETKPKSKIPIRLKWMTPVKGKVPVALVKAWAAYDKAWAAYDKAGAAYDKAWAAYDKAWAAYDKAWAAYDKARAARDKAWDAARPALERLHKKEHGNECPWNGRTLFG